MKNSECKMQNGGRRKRLAFALVSSFFILHSALGEITATVYPGYQFSANERPTTSTLNLLARPTIYITGTLGGTNVALAANSVTTTMLSDTLPGSNLVWDASSPRKLVIANSGVDTNQIAVGLAGLGLGGGGGAPLSNKLDNAFLIITNDVVTISLANFTNLISVIATNVANYLTTNYVATNAYVVSEFSVPGAGLVVTNTHPLGVVPGLVRWVLRCVTADAGYVPGDEVDVAGAGYWSAEDTPAFNTWANSTNCGVARSDRATSLELFDRTGVSTETPLTESRWRLKAYLRP